MQSFSWIPEYIFSKGHSFKEYIEKNLPIENEDSKKILLLVDRMDQEGFSLTNQVGSSLEKRGYTIIPTPSQKLAKNQTITRNIVINIHIPVSMKTGELKKERSP